MKDLIDILADSLSEESPEQKKKIMRLVQQLYFHHVRDSRTRRQNPLEESEAFHIASDIIKVEDNLDLGLPVKNLLQDVTDADKDNHSFGLVSKTIRKALVGWTNRRELAPKDEKEEIPAQVLSDYRHYVPAIMITELIQDEKRKTNIRWYANLLISLLIAAISLLGAVLLRKSGGE